MFIRKVGDSIVEVSHKRIERPEKSIYFNHIHRHCELLLFISGKAEYNIDGQIYTPSEYDLILIPGGVYHYLIPTSHSPYENYVVGIDPEVIAPSHYQKLFSPPHIINIKEDKELNGFFSRLDSYNELYSDADFDKAASSLISELITWCAYRKDSLTSPESTGFETIDRIIAFISKNLEKPLNAEIISKNMLLSRSYVQNIFSQTMHIGLKEYILQKKIYSAQKDILQGLTPIQACEKYSFGDYSSFYRLYKKTFGSSPRHSV